NTDSSATDIVTSSTMMMMTMSSSSRVKPRLLISSPLFVEILDVVAGARFPVGTARPQLELLAVHLVLDRTLPRVHELSVFHPTRLIERRRQIFKLGGRNSLHALIFPDFQAEPEDPVLRVGDLRRLDKMHQAERQTRENEEHH